MGRILWLHARPVYPPRGGAEVRCAGLIELAGAAGHEVMLAHPAGPPTSEKPAPVARVELELRSGLTKWMAKIFSQAPLRAPRLTRRARRALDEEVKKFNPDVIVLSDILTWGYAARVVPVSPWLYDAHNIEHQLWESHLAGAAGYLTRLSFFVDHRRVRRLERRLLASASGVMCVSAVDAAQLRSICTTSHVEVVPNSVGSPSHVVAPS